MTPARFRYYELRAIDVDAARAFYTSVLGVDFWGPDLGVAPLPERARAMGAPPHWLGHVGVSNVEASVGRILAAGGEQRGPTRYGTDGASTVVLRDPFGAVLAVTSEPREPGRRRVIWHAHHSEDEARAFPAYTDWFGWTGTAVLELGDELGKHQQFAWDATGEPVGSMTNLARQPQVHTQWLFCFRVDDLDRALARVRELGGLVLDPWRTPSGDRLAGCDDAQGAAFALYEVAAGSVLSDARSRPPSRR